MRYRTSKKLEKKYQCLLFPKELETPTEFWFDWTDAEILSIQRAMIVQALNELRDHRRSREMRLDAWNWLFSDEEHYFSSRVCAKNNRLDIETLRRIVRRLVNDI